MAVAASTSALDLRNVTSPVAVHSRSQVADWMYATVLRELFDVDAARASR